MFGSSTGEHTSLFLYDRIPAFSCRIPNDLIARLSYRMVSEFALDAVVSDRKAGRPHFILNNVGSPPSRASDAGRPSLGSSSVRDDLPEPA